MSMVSTICNDIQMISISLQNMYCTIWVSSLSIWSFQVLLTNSWRIFLDELENNKWPRVKQKYIMRQSSQRQTTDFTVCPAMSVFESAMGADSNVARRARSTRSRLFSCDLVENFRWDIIVHHIPRGWRCWSARSCSCWQSDVSFKSCVSWKMAKLTSTLVGKCHQRLPPFRRQNRVYVLWVLKKGRRRHCAHQHFDIILQTEQKKMLQSKSETVQNIIVNIQERRVERSQGMRPSANHSTTWPDRFSCNCQSQDVMKVHRAFAVGPWHYRAFDPPRLAGFQLRIEWIETPVMDFEGNREWPKNIRQQCPIY